MSGARTEAAAPAPRGPRGPMGGGVGLPVAKAQNFGPSAKRLLRTLRTDMPLLILVLVFSVLSVTLSVIGPKLLGEATNILFAGYVSLQTPEGMTRQQVIDGLIEQGNAQQAEMLSAMEFVPGAGVDFEALARIVVLVLAVYIFASIFGWLQARILNGIVQRAMHRLRMQVEDKIHRLPLAYFDRVQRGELLSRVTNDVDNIGQTMQQTLSQVVTSLLTVIGVLVMMFIISPLLAMIALVTIPLTIVITVLVARQSQKMFVAQWKATGILNARVEETFSGHAVVKTFGHQKEAEADFLVENEEVYRASFGAQFLSGIIMPAMMFIGNLVYVAIAVVGGIQVAAGLMSIGDVQAFIQYSRQFTQPLSQLGSMANLLQSGVASAERVFELLDEEEQEPDDTEPETAPEWASHLAFEDVDFRYVEDKPLIRGLSIEANPGSTVAIVGPTGAGKTTLVNLIMRFYDVDAGRIVLDGFDTRHMTRDDLRSAHRDGAAGHLAVLRDDPREHRVRPAGCDRGGDHRGGHRGVRRPLRARTARRLRHDARRRGHQPERRRAAADHDRPRLPRRPADPHPRRGHLVGRHPHRAAHPAGDVAAAGRPDCLRHRAPPLHDPGCRSHPRHGGRRDRRAGVARRAAALPWRVLPALQRAVRGGDRRGVHPGGPWTAGVSAEAGPRAASVRRMPRRREAVH